MYNSEQKERFISGYAYAGNVVESCTATFEKTAAIEEELGKDFCEMNAQEAQSVIDVVGSLRGNNARVNILYAYTRWCLWNHIPGATDAPLKTERQSLVKIRQRMVSGPVHLQICLDRLFEPEGNGTADNLYRCFCWFAFMGAPQQAARSITEDEVDFADMVIRHELQSYPIYRESLQTFRNCISMTDLAVPCENGIRRISRADGKELLRGVRGPLTIDNMRATLAHKRKAKQEQDGDAPMFTYNSLTLSGVFYRVYEKERAGIAPDLSPLAVSTMAGKFYRLPRGLTLRGKQNQLTSAYLEDYYAWKSVFC